MSGFSRIVPKSQRLYRLFRRYCDWIDGENNGNFLTNGEADFLRSQLSGAPVIFDVGANKGEWTSMALSFHPGANIHCFEPIAALHEKLLHCGFPANVRLNRIALSSTRCMRPIDTFTASFERRPRAGQAGSATAERAEMVEVETVDNYCEQAGVSRVDFLKMDVEGHELAVLQGARRMIDSERILRIQFEYSRCNIDARILLKDFFDFFAGTNYTVFKMLPRGLLRIPEYMPRLENFKYKNFAVIHNSVPPRS